MLIINQVTHEPLPVDPILGVHRKHQAISSVAIKLWCIAHKLNSWDGHCKALAQKYLRHAGSTPARPAIIKKIMGRSYNGNMRRIIIINCQLLKLKWPVNRPAHQH